MQAAEELLECARKGIQHLASTGRLPVGDLQYDSLPAEMLAFQALIHTQKENPDQAIEFANQALQVAPSGAPAISASALLALQVAYRQKGNLAKAIEACRQAIPLSRMVDNVNTRVSVLHNLGVGLMIQGKLNQLRQVYQDGLHFAEMHGELDHPRYDVIYFKLADIAYLRNDLDQAAILLDQGFKCSEHNTNLWPRFYGKIIQVQLILARGDQQAALNWLAELEGLLERVRGAYFEAELADYLVRIRVILGKMEGVRAWVQAKEKTLKMPPEFIKLETAIQLAYIYEALGDLDLAVSLAEQLEKITADLGCLHLQLYSLIPLIKAWSKKGNQPVALTYLHKALTLAEPEGYLRVFLDQGKIMFDLLQTAESLWQTESIDSLIHCLLAAFSETLPLNQQVVQSQRLVCPLSERELQVLGLIAVGRSNKEIAQELFIAIGTVKRHTVNIYYKLDVSNRTEAVVKANNLRLLQTV